jgi:azurin
VLFRSDQGQSKIVRVAMEKVDGVYQGAAFGFFKGFASGVMRLSWGQDGSLFAAQSNRGWGSTGPASYALQRLVWSGKTPFEMKTIRAMPDGFEIEFTQPVDKATAQDPNSYQVSSFTYKYHPVYGSPAVNLESHALKGIKVSPDGLKVRLVVDQARQYYIHELTLSGVKAYNDGAPLLHPTGYYTLNRIPEGPKLDPASLPRMVASEKVQGGSAIKEAPQQASPDAIAALTGTPQKSQSDLPTRKKKTPALAKNQVTLPAHWEDGAELTIRMGTEPGLKFSVTDMTVEAGTRIKLIFSNPDDMPHNFILTQPGQADRVGEAALKLGVRGMELNYAPDLPAVLYYTKLLQPGTSQTLYFEAPAEPGVYPYVCTYPGHYVTMRGVLRVK